ncbi:Rv2175c family DNA-binding protein [Schaalia sp. Marseille-Q2122]|uniref:Rv2175c family DNA-binding protein n=1 Tax=Schaalia sp. Marseille-Q2122 TaxID=2736604 RepID=UPI00158960E7|nr:Rv2175c family DNA-binding protein [Schaalia sp. Marseille-Q2122]
MSETPRLLSFVQAAELLGIPPHRIKQLLREHQLFVVTSDEGKPAIPAETIVNIDGRWIPLENLQGTLTVLADCGFTAEETAAWMYAYEGELEQTPMEALLQGRHHRVNNIARMLAL